MTNFIRNRCHVLFFCTSLNSAQTVQDNIISMFTMCAKRMHIHIHSTNFSRLYRNRPFMASVIFNCIRYGAWQVCSTLSRRRKLDLTASDENTQYLLDDSLPVRYDEVTTICIWFRLQLIVPGDWHGDESLQLRFTWVCSKLFRYFKNSRATGAQVMFFCLFASLPVTTKYDLKNKNAFMRRLKFYT